MAMSASGLKTAIKSALTDLLGAPEDADKQDAAAEAFADAIVTYIQSNAAVTGTCVVGSGSSAGSWPVTGTVG